MLVARTTPEPLSMVPAVRAQVAGPTLDQPIYGVKTMEQTVSGHLALRRFTMFVLIIFASVALLLATVGIYGVMSYAVTRRVHELGIRAALGASRQEIVGLVLRQGMTQVGVTLVLNGFEKVKKTSPPIIVSASDRLLAEPFDR